MSAPADPRLQRLLGADHLASLRKRLRRRFERAPVDRPIDHIRIGGLAAEEHAALASLIGRPQRYSGSMQIDVSLVDAALQRSGIASSLCDALERLDGPIANLAATRLRLENLWSSVIGNCSHPDLIAFLRDPEGIGLLKRLARQNSLVAAELCRGAEAVLRHLPANGIARSQLSAQALGDAHALDDGQPIATVMLAIQRRLVPTMGADRLAELTPAPQRDGAVERTRDTWARAGVLVNELARPVLVLNLPTKSSENACWRRAIARRWCVSKACRRPRSNRCYRSSHRRGCAFAITATSTGRDCVSPTTSCAVSVPRRGALARPITRLRSKPRRVWGIL